MDVSTLVQIKKNPKIPDITPGDTVRVSVKIVESGKERIQVFQGVVIKIKHGGNGAAFTVRHVAYGVGVERTFPFNSPLVDKVEIVRQGKVRRARLYYLRGLSGKAARRKIKRVERKVREQVGEELLVAPPEEELPEEELVAQAPAEPEPAKAEVTEAPAKPEPAKAEATEAPAKPEPAKAETTEAAAAPEPAKAEVVEIPAESEPAKAEVTEAPAEAPLPAEEKDKETPAS
jgi:large subunit ribosomal protein L19